MNHPIVHWVGDSTVKKNNINRYPQSGIGQYFDLFLKPEILIRNHAENGRSTKSFLAEGRADAVKAELKPGDFLFIQFGHNDAKSFDPSRYTEAFGEYSKNLELFIDMALDRGAHPLIITPLYRRLFKEDGKHLEPFNHLDYPEACKRVAIRREVPFVDLCSLSFELIEKAGAEETRSWFMHLENNRYLNFKQQTDNSHLKPKGAIIFGSLIADELAKADGPYKDILIPLENASSYSEIALYPVFGGSSSVIFDTTET